MKIDAAEAGDFKESLRQNLPERNDNNQIWLQFPDNLYEFRNTHFDRLQNGNAMFLRQDFNRRCGQLLSAPFGTVRLGNHGNDFFSPFYQFLQAWTGEVGGPHEEQAELRHYSP